MLRRETSPEWVAPLVQVLNGESLLQDGRVKGGLSEAASNRIKGLCADLTHLELIRQMLWEREPHARDMTEGRTWLWPNFKFDDPTSEDLNTRGEQLLKRVNARLRCYPQFPGIMLVADERSLRLAECQQISTSNYLEQGCVWGVLGLLEEETLHRLRLCLRSECRRWFFAAIDHQKYCSGSCRQRHAAQDEAFKEKRRLYMRKRRRDEKAFDAREKRLARGE
jgi:hypothetical protein